MASFKSAKSAFKGSGLLQGLKTLFTPVPVKKSKPMVFPSNIYAPNTKTVVGNTVSNYLKGVQQPVAANNGRLYGAVQTRKPAPAPARSGPGGAYPVAGGYQAPAPSNNNYNLGGGYSDGGTALSAVAEEPEIVDLPSWIFEGNVFKNYIDYMNAINGSVDRELQSSLGLLEGERSKARGESDRSRSSLLAQVADLLSDLSSRETKGQNDIGAYYGGLGDIYQSSEGVRRDQFTGEVNTERSRVNRDRDTNMAEIDRALNEYISGTDQQQQSLVSQARGLKDQNYASANDFRSQLAYSPNSQLRQVDPQLGNIQLSDTSALLAQLNQYLTPDNIRSGYRYRSGGDAANPIYSYLNAMG